MAKHLLRLMTELSSRKWLSKLMGRFSHSGVSRYLIPTFIRVYQIPAHEAEKEIHEYRSLNEFFSRRLKIGMRSIDDTQSAMVSPVDATITAQGLIQAGTIVNVKGQDYTIAELLNHSPRIEHYINGYVFVLYLSPTDYHRIHSPVTGVQTESEHLKGKVYPVNDFAMTHIRSVLSRNERLITYIAHEFGEVAVVKVGAMNVSSIQYVSDEVKQWQIGDELAYFEFGSTVVLLTESGTFTPRGDLETGSRVKMGELLGVLHPNEKAN
ncbi:MULTISPECIES: archaetidylserine decarboxylase [Paenibacillus]|uniref:phosphatidylserine decarboxylase n=1 Tax=Paenibacillus campinasensis TaxID=66347 RepID=A0A268EXZ1_9BACL|nr:MULTISPECIES: archaetidylserine decarboxylase [Paenibacillus]MUG66519.1 phosphatidylserine decarboxylase [Paenibacillus campinasensis]PAD77989.1 phosphatidylserine decarboxylase [Paenibacillus campinasensis]PAK52931.1 phosphatidylserine decarboxylase [Paenibacillus sp. 7541]